MPVLDRKPIGGDYDAEHHSRLIDRQHKNNNDASPIFASIPIWLAVVVQQEDSGPWTHGTIVGIGDHNHHNHLYTVQLTSNGRRIACNRQHIKPTSVTADAYIQYQATKHTNRQTDPLEDILECIRNNPAACYSGPMHNNGSNGNNIHKLHAKQQPKNIPQGRGQDLIQKNSK